MGSAFSNPYAFRRTVASLHYKDHPLSGGGVDLGLFWRTLFCTRLTAEEHNSFWTAEDVRLLRLYHPDRLAAVLLGAMQQLDAFMALTCAANPVRRGSAGGNTLAVGATGQRVSEPFDDAQSGQENESGAPPLDVTAVQNSLWLIAGALPYCFEDIDELKARLREDAEGEIGKRPMVIVSQHTRRLIGEEERTESPFAAEFAYHFFFRGDACVGSDAPSDGEDFADDDIFSYLTSSRPPPLGARLVELLVRLYFVPGFTTTASLPHRPMAKERPTEQERGEWPHKLSESNIEDDLKLLVGLDCVPPPVLFSIFPDTVTESNNDVLSNGDKNEFVRIPAHTTTTPKTTRMMMTPLNENYRAIILRTLVLTLSGFIFIPFSESDLTSVRQDSKHNCSQSRSEKTVLMMIHALFNGRQRSLLAMLCVSLLHVVRCYPKRPLVSTTASAWIWGGYLTSDHVDVLKHALSILAMGLYSESSALSFCPRHVARSSESTTNVFLQIMGAALKHSESPVEGVGESSDYVRSLVEGLLVLFEGPLLASARNAPEAAIPSTPLVLHLLLWVLQQSPVALGLVGGRAQTLMALVYNLLVSSTASTSRFGEGQLTLLCLLLLARHPSFLQLLATPLPSVDSGATAVEAQKFLSMLRAAMPMLPEKVIISGNGAGANPLEPPVGSDTLCVHTYGNILVLALCYVVSPSSPRWFRLLYRSTIEVLHTLQVCFTTLPPTRDMSFSHYVLNPCVMLELASGLDYLSSVRVLRLGTEEQRACVQMIRVLLAIIRSPVRSSLPEHTDSRGSLRQSGTQQKGSELLPLLCGLAMRRGVFGLARLIDTTAAMGPVEESDAPLPHREGGFVGASSMFVEDENRRENPTGERADCHSADVPRVTATLCNFARLIASSDEFAALYGVVAEVRRRMQTQNEWNGAAETLDASSPWLRDITEVLGLARTHKRHLRKESGDGAGKERTSATVIRRVTTDGSISAERWLIAQLWRQLHMFNLSPPIFDYRSAVLVRE